MQQIKGCWAITLLQTLSKTERQLAHEHASNSWENILRIIQGVAVLGEAEMKTEEDLSQVDVKFSQNPPAARSCQADQQPHRSGGANRHALSWPWTGQKEKRKGKKKGKRYNSELFSSFSSCPTWLLKMINTPGNRLSSLKTLVLFLCRKGSN